jgi:hypothetical protein
MADAADSKSVGRKAVWVRLPPPALSFLKCSMCCESHAFKGDLNERLCNFHTPFTMCGPIPRSYRRVIESAHMREASWR